MIKSIVNPHTGQTIKFGRRRPVSQGPHFKLSNYMRANIPKPPTTLDYTKKAGVALSKIYLNDQLGDCVIAGMGHVDDVLLGNAGSVPPIFTSAQLIRLYSAIGGYIPGNSSSDQGCDEVTAMNYWHNHGLLVDGSHKISGWMKVNGKDLTECRTALWLFENLVFGIELPDQWISPFPSSDGFTWDVAGSPDQQNGHCFIADSYTQHSFGIDTWGLLGNITNAAIAKYATTFGSGELYSVISKDAIIKATNKCPAGFDWSQLAADMDSMGGSVHSV